MSGVIGVIRTTSSDDALAIARSWDPTTLIGIEITLTVPNAFQVIQTLIDEGIDRVGAGTVRTTDQVIELSRIGAKFIVSPHLDEAIVKTAVDFGLNVTPGTMTPTEMVQAMTWGATNLKVFPISALGGLSFVNMILEPLPDLPLILSGGIKNAEVSAYLATGVRGVCLSDALWDQDIIASGDIELGAAFTNNILEQIK
jgi:2-dehydro-3-deoxyphosphogluconate aldolase/(4S)-4-hydroxy-2-oxoglutarate aldolase